MGLIKDILGKLSGEGDRTLAAPFFKTFTEYTPSFTSFNGGVYEMALTRSAVHAFATACSKLKPEVSGSANPRIRRAIATSPNEFTTWPRFLYRLATILECDTTAYVVPELSADGEEVYGLWPLKCEQADIVDYNGVPWIRFWTGAEDVLAIELNRVCIISKYQYVSDFFGSLNVLGSTMALLDAQDKAQIEAIKSSAKLRFIGALNGRVQEEDMEKKRERFAGKNLSAMNKSGLLLYDQTFGSLEQIKPYNYTVPADEMERIEKSVYTYFGTNEKILQNDFDEDSWNAYYEGKVEPFAIQLGEGLSHMLYTQRERANNSIMFSSNRMQYATSASKRNMIRDMLDRGVFSINEARNILQMPPEEGGDIRVIRGEYIDATMLQSTKKDSDPTQHDEVKKDSDLHGSGDSDSLDE